MLKGFLFLIVAALAVTLILWLFDPVVQVYDRTKITDLSDPRHYTMIDRYSDGLAERKGVDLTVIFPAFNEEQRITTTLDLAIKFLLDWAAYRQWTFEIIVVNDGGTDSTVSIAKTYYQKYQDVFRIISLKKNQGKGGAVKVGVQEALGKYILMADADGATDIEDLDRLMKEMENMEADNSVKDHPMEVGMVLGSRAHLAEKSIASREFYRTVLMKGFHFLVVILCTNQIQDTQCGFKLFTKHVANKIFGNLHLFRWAFDIELIYQAEACGIAMKEVSVNWREVEGSKLIKSKFDVVTTSLTMARDMLAVRLAYVLGLWQLPSDSKNDIKVEL